MAVRHALGRIVSVWRCHVLSPIVPSCFTSSLLFRQKGFALVHPCHTEIHCLSGDLWSDAEAIHECILSCPALSQVAR